MFVFFWSSSGRRHERLPCGLRWRKLVELCRKSDSRYYWYNFKLHGKRYRRSPKETQKDELASRFPSGLQATLNIDGGGAGVGICDQPMRLLPHERRAV